jgi:hypothetical protein
MWRLAYSAGSPFKKSRHEGAVVVARTKLLTARQAERQPPASFLKL